MKRYDILTPRSGNVSGIGGGIHSFAVSFVVKKSGTVKASDLGLPFFYVAPLQEGEVTITPSKQQREGNATFRFHEE